MRLSWALWASALNVLTTRAQSSSSSPSISISILTGSNIPTSAFTGSDFTYISYTSQQTVQTGSTTATSGTHFGTLTAPGNSSAATAAGQTTITRSSQTLIEIGGQTYTVNSTSNANATATATTSSATPVNTLPCNNYPEFCNRKYSNITEVCAHNSAFVKKNNAASNQQYGIIDQLNDGVRMIQGETQYVNGSIYMCHSSCDLLNVGKWGDSLDEIAGWIADHPYDVVTILIGNSNFADGVTVTDYVPTIQNSSIAQYLYEPAYIPQHRDQWPTLGEMILSGKRVVMFMDYNANQTQIPYVLDEFTHMWETPFSPVDDTFPCDQQRPPNLNATIARDQYMYMANHNLNVAIDVSVILGNGGNNTILIPDSSRINRTNGEYDQSGMLGAMSSNCTQQWGRPPNFLLVDFYNRGYPSPGSVFEVAAQANGVKYTQKCCGNGESAAAHGPRQSSWAALAAVITFATVILGW